MQTIPEALETLSSELFQKLYAEVIQVVIFAFKVSYIILHYLNAVG